MSVLGMLEGGTIEVLSTDSYRFRLEMKFPDGKRHGVMSVDLKEAFEAMADWRHHETGAYDKWYEQELQRLETRKKQDRESRS